MDTNTTHKKNHVGFLALFMALSLVACGSNKKTGGGGDDPRVTPTPTPTASPTPVPQNHVLLTIEAVSTLIDGAVDTEMKFNIHAQLMNDKDVVQVFQETAMHDDGLLVKALKTGADADIGHLVLNAAKNDLEWKGSASPFTFDDGVLPLISIESDTQKFAETYLKEIIAKGKIALPTYVEFDDARNVVIDTAPIDVDLVLAPTGAGISNVSTCAFEFGPDTAKKSIGVDIAVDAATPEKGKATFTVGTSGLTPTPTDASFVCAYTVDISKSSKVLVIHEVKGFKISLKSS